MNLEEEFFNILLAQKTYGQYRVFGKSLRLPTEYQEVEYIESTGTQYINIGQNIQKNYKIEIGFAYSSFAGQYPTVFGSVSCEIYTDTNGNVRSYGAITISQPTQFVLNQKADIKATISADIIINQMLFAYNTGVEIKYFSEGKMYYFRKYNNNNELLMYLIPCYRKADNVIGMYDLVNGVFYTNQGTGTFLKGNNVIYNATSPFNFYKGNTLVSTFYPSTPLVLNGIGTVKDYWQNWNGLVNRKIGVVDMGSLSWDYSANYQVFSASVPTLKVYSFNEDVYALCSKYEVQAKAGIMDNVQEGKAMINHTNRIVRVKDQNYTTAQTFKTAMSGVYLYYELATPTTETINSLMLPKGITKITDANGVELEFETI